MSPRSTKLAHAMASLFTCAALIIGPMLPVQAAHAAEHRAFTDAISNVLETALDKTDSIQKSSALKDDARAQDFYFAQGASGRCTIASVAMMLRRAAYLDDREDWQSITLESTMADGWTSVGVKNDFSSAGYDVGLIDVTGSKDTLLALLADHPEGVAIYDRGVPHALLLCDYDEQTDTFYCADPADHYSGKRMPLADSWNGERHGMSQDAVIAGISGAWIVKAKASL